MLGAVINWLEKIGMAHILCNHAFVSFRVVETIREVTATTLQSDTENNFERSYSSNFKAHISLDGP